jgi:hypothetical protein
MKKTEKETPKRKFVVVDENNHWLAYGEFSSPVLALAEAYRSDDFEDGVEIRVFEVKDEFVYRMEERE